VNTNKPGLNGISTGFTQGVFDLGVGAQFDALYQNIAAFLNQSMYAQPGGLISGATSSSYTTPTLQVGDNGSKLICFLVQVVTVSQSVGNLPNSQIAGVPAPFTKPMQLFSVGFTPPVVLTVN